MWPLIVIAIVAAELVVVALLFKLVDLVEWAWGCWFARRERIEEMKAAGRRQERELQAKYGRWRHEQVRR
jgi:hypothetical protein